MKAKGESGGWFTSASESAATKLERELAESHKAIEALTWVGTSMFIALCVVQSAFSLLPYIGGNLAQQETTMSHLQIAGFVTSCAAIYNLICVEGAFHTRLGDLSPFSKFLTVKFLVSLTFIQQTILGMLQVGNTLIPSAVQGILRSLPLLGDILHMSHFQSHFFMPALVIYECLILSG